MYEIRKLRNMKKMLVAILFSVLLAVGCGVFVARADYTGELGKQMSAAAGTQGANFAKPKDPRDAAVQVIQLSLGFIGILFTVYLLYAGFLIMMAGGDEEKVKKGKHIIKYSVIGILIVLSAYGIAAFTDQELRKAQQQSGEGPLYAGVEFSTDEYMGDFNNNDPLNENVSIGDGGTFW